MAIVRKRVAQPSAPIDAGRTEADLNSRLAAAGLLTIPLNVQAVAEYLGLEVVEEPMDDDLSGYLEARGGTWVVGVNAFHHINRKRFTIAHEIAHFMLHSEHQASFQDRTFSRREADPNPMEREADRFAAELIMPAPEVRRLIASGTTSLSGLAEIFRVSALAMKYRVQNLGYQVNQ
jgi:Zn-dependent peptidase ImmA (M78 family)